MARNMSITFVADFPPSVNSYYRNVKGKTLISKKGRDYRAKIYRELNGLGPLFGALEVKMILYPPDKRKRDIDNYQKALFDAITHAGIWEDDSQIKRVVIEMKRARKGQAHVQIREILVES